MIIWPTLAILRVLLDHDQSSGAADRFLDRGVIPRYDRAEIDQVDAHFAAVLSSASSDFSLYFPMRPCDIRAAAPLARLAHGTARIGSVDSRSAQIRCFGMSTNVGSVAMHCGPEESGRISGVSRITMLIPG